jgi:hypothetical protein
VGEIDFDFAHAHSVRVGDGEAAVAHPTGANVWRAQFDASHFANIGNADGSQAHFVL